MSGIGAYIDPAYLKSQLDDLYTKLNALNNALTSVGTDSIDVEATVVGSQAQPLQQRATTYDLLVQLRHAGTEIPLPTALTAGGGVKVGVVDSLPAGSAKIGEVDAVQSGAWTVASTQSGTWNIGTLTTITNPVGISTITNPVGISNLDTQDYDTGAGTDTVAVMGLITPGSGGAAVVNLPPALTAGGGVKVGVVDSLPAGTNNIGKVDVVGSQAQSLQQLATHYDLLVQLRYNGSNVVLPTALTAGGGFKVGLTDSLPAGTNNIGDVDIASALPAGTNNIGDVDIASALPTGTNWIGKVSIGDGTNVFNAIQKDIGGANRWALGVIPNDAHAITRQPNYDELAVSTVQANTTYAAPGVFYATLINRGDNDVLIRINSDVGEQVTIPARTGTTVKFGGITTLYYVTGAGTSTLVVTGWN